MVRHMVSKFLSYIAGLTLVMGLAACATDLGSNLPTFSRKAGTIASIEMLWPDGSGMGSFVSAIGGGATAKLRYRVQVGLEDGHQAFLKVDGDAPLAVGERVEVDFARIYPRSPDALPVPTPEMGS